MTSSPARSAAPGSSSSVIVGGGSAGHSAARALGASGRRRGYHLPSMPGNRTRTAAEWLLDAVLPRPTVQLGLARGSHVPLETAAPERRSQR